jgi:DNA-binding transcriptional MerR regulator
MLVELLTAEELAERHRVRPGTIRLWSRQGLIPSRRLARKVIRFCLLEVLTALESREERRAER